MTKITLIGAGNVAHHLAHRLTACQYQIIQIYSRNIAKATSLAKATNAQATDQITAIKDHADIYIIAIKDDAISTIAAQLSFLSDKIICHTSGTVPSDVLAPYFSQYGVFYPLQTFSKQRKSNFETLPFCIFGNNQKTQNSLYQLAKNICPNIYLVDDKQRASLHVAAVIVNNFSNFLFGIGQDICQKEAVDFNILKPLLQETIDKIQDHSPQEVQTGPAARKDLATIDKHLHLLKKYPNYQAIYQLLSDNIMKL